MKIIKETITKTGKRVVIDLVHGETLFGVAADSYYKLGQPVEDVVSSHVLKDTVAVYWCSAQQKWVS